MKKNINIIITVSWLFFQWTLVFIFIIVSLVWPFKSKPTVIENQESSAFTFEQLKRFQKAIQWGWDADRAFYYLEQHTFQRLFLQEWVRMYPRLSNNQLEFNYQTNYLELPIAVKILYKDPFAKSVLKEWNFKIKVD